MTDLTPLPFDLPAVARKKLTVDFDGDSIRKAAAKRAGLDAMPNS